MPADIDDVPRSDGLAIGALICGIVGLLIPPVGLVGLVLGIVALTKGQSRGMAITGIVLGSLWLLLVPFAIIAAIAIPNLLESRIVANESAACAALKSGIFPAEIQYQAGAYRDRDGNNIGEYGDLPALSSGDLRLLQGPVATGTANGYRFVVHVPEGAKDAERCFIAYAWPASPDQGHKAFALAQDGQVRELPAKDLNGREPAWDAALPNGWGQPPSWSPSRR